MPLFQLRLEAPDDEHERVEQVLTDHPRGAPGRVDRHFRVSVLEADTPEAARRVLERRELKRVLFEAPAGELGDTASMDLNRLIVHSQQQPWPVVSVEEA